MGKQKAKQLESFESMDEAFQAQLKNVPVEITRENVTVKRILANYKAGDLDLQPSFQRKYVWKKDAATQLIESIMLGLPIPGIYVHRTVVEKAGEMTTVDAVIDGQQRLTTVVNFLLDKSLWHGSDDFALSACEELPILRYKKFRDFSPDMVMALLNYQFRFTAIKGNGEAVGKLFYRLNRRSMQLTTQEIRNAVYPGSFNNFCKRLAAHPYYEECIADSRISRMQAVEDVVRFFAFLRNGPGGYAKNGSNLRRFLDTEMSYRQENFTPEMGENLEKLFVHALTMSKEVFGNKMFRKSNTASAKYAPVMFELLMTAFARLSADAIRAKSVEIQNAVWSLCAQDTFKAFADCATADRMKVVTRFQMFKKMLEKVVKTTIDFETMPGEPAPIVPPTAQQVDLLADVVSEKSEALEYGVKELPLAFDEVIVESELRDEPALDAGDEFLRDCRAALAGVPTKDRICGVCNSVITDAQVATADFTRLGDGDVEATHCIADCYVPPVPRASVAALLV